MLLVTFLHGLRVSEVVGGYDKDGVYHLGLSRANIIDGHLCVQRRKGSKKTVQPLLDPERDAVLNLAATVDGEFFPMTRMTFWRKMQMYGECAGLPAFKRHGHSLKHTCGRLGYLNGMGVAEIVAYLGHVNPANSLIYAQADEVEACSVAAGAFAKVMGSGLRAGTRRRAI
jgi:integrase